MCIGRNPGGVGRNRFFGEDVLAGVDGGGDVQRAEARRGREDHQIDVRRDHLLVGVEADEAVVVLDGELVAELREGFLRAVDAFLKDVAHCDDLDILV